MDTASDYLALLQSIKGLAYKFETQGYLLKSLDKAKEAFYLCSQAQNESNSSYLDHFKGMVDVISHYDGDIGTDPALTWLEMKRKKFTVNPNDPPQASKDAYDKCVPLAKARYLGTAFLN